MLTQERLNQLNEQNERNDKMYQIEIIGFNEKRSGLYREDSDTYYGSYNTLEEANKAMQEAVRYAQLEYKYYEVYIEEATEEHDEIYYEQLTEYTVANCITLSNKMKAQYI